MKKIILLLTIVLVSVLTGCSKWLEVKPSDRVTEENTFSTPQSFKQALNGVYIELNREGIYGKTLSCDFIDILAQYYAIHPESINNVELSQYKFTSSSNLSKISNIWSTSYNLIANINKIIENASKNSTVLTKDDNDLITGEAYALRALLHFDLFRLFGPVYTKGDATASIPYYISFVLDPQGNYPANEFLEHVISDLKMAVTLLSKDPIIQFGPKGDGNDKFKEHRQFRLNYYAAKALLARVYLYAEEKELALQQAKDVIAVQEKWFPWIKVENVSSDQLFSTEILFGLQNMRRRDLFTSLFDSRNLNQTSALTPREDIVLKLFNYQRHDYRYLANLQSNVLIGATNFKLFEKYAANTDSLSNQFIPMIRMSEVYYIAAECEPVKADGLKQLNTVRNKRGIASSGSDSYYFPNELLLSEYTREFWGEGQLFYFFKRRKIKSIQSSLDEWTQVNMVTKNYVLPIPEGESKYN